MTLLRYQIRRVRLLWTLLAIGLFAFHWLMPVVYRSIKADGVQPPHFILRLIPKAIQEFIGVDRLPLDSAEGFVSVVYQHPFVMIALFAFPIVASATLLTSEIEKHTLALILSRPVRRVAIIGSAALVVLAGEWLLVAIMLAGTHFGFQHAGLVPPAPDRLARLGLAVYALGCAVAGLCLFFSSTSDESSDATGWPVTILLLMYVGNYLAQLWAPLRPYARFSLIYYYQPVRVFTDGALPTTSYTVFAAVAGVGFLLAGAVYARREFRI